MSLVFRIGVLLFLTIGSGVWLSSYGKPLNTAIFTLHKLIALGTVIYMVIIIRSIIKSTDINSLILFMIIASGLSIIVLFVSGALMSLGISPYSLIKTIHTITTFSALVATIISFYLLLIRN